MRLELATTEGFEGRPNRSDDLVKDPDERIGDLQYRSHQEFAVGHGVSVEAPTARPVTKLATTWLPRVDVRTVVQDEIAGVTVSMEALAARPDGASFRTALDPLVDAYTKWIAKQAVRDVGRKERTQIRDHLAGEASHARDRIREAIAALFAQQGSKLSREAPFKKPPRGDEQTPNEA